MADSDIFSFLHQVQLDSEANAQSETTLGKRTRGTDSADEDEDIDESGSQANTGNGDATTLIESEETPWEVSLPSAQLNQNVVAFARQAGAARKLNDDHLRLLEKFAKSSAEGRFVMLFAEILGNREQVQKVWMEAAPWAPSDTLKVNIMYAAGHMLLSARVAGYRATSTTGLLLSQVERNYSDSIPPNMDINHAAKETLTESVRYALTQVRGEMKKTLKASDKTKEPKKNWRNIYELAEELIKPLQKKGVRGTESVKITAPLCARFSMIRALYLNDSSSNAADPDKFWIRVDRRLDEIRAMAKGNQAHENKLFSAILDNDRDTYGIRGSYIIADA